MSFHINPFHFFEFTFIPFCPSINIDIEKRESSPDQNDTYSTGKNKKKSKKQKRK